MPRRKNKNRLWWCIFSDTAITYEKSIHPSGNKLCDIKADRDRRTERKQRVTLNIHNPYRTATTALPRATLALHGQPKVTFFGKGRVSGMHGLITSNHHKESTTCCNTKHNSHYWDLVLCCKDKEELTNSITNDRDTHQSMPSGDEYSSRSIKQKIYVECNSFVSLLKVLRIADSRKVHTSEEQHRRKTVPIIDKARRWSFV